MHVCVRQTPVRLVIDDFMKEIWLMKLDTNPFDYVCVLCHNVLGLIESLLSVVLEIHCIDRAANAS